MSLNGRGESVDSDKAMALVNSVLGAGCRVATLEVAAMGLKMGVPLAVTTQVLNRNSGRNRVTQLVLPALVEGRAPAADMLLARLLKDVNHAMGLAMELGVPMPMTAIVRGLLQAFSHELGPGAQLSQLGESLGGMSGVSLVGAQSGSVDGAGEVSHVVPVDLRVGYVGLGKMGGALARRLMQSQKLTVFDLRPDLMRALVDEGALGAAGLDTLARECDVVFTCLPTSADVRSAIFGRGGLAEGLAPGAVIVDQTTGDPTLTRQIATDLEKLGIGLVDATVSGAPRIATAGTINMMAGGPAAALGRVRAILESITPNVSWCGGSGNGHAAKLINHAVAAVNRLLTYEAVAMGFKFGLALGAMSQVINEGTGWSSAAEKIIPALATGSPTANLALELMVKDLQLAARMAIDCGATLLVSNQARALFETGVHTLGGDQTLDAMARLFEDAAGIRFASS
jgi:3-hydroxyisobutyrate dehydrogenase